ncbi:MAG: aldehyde dehydrogenase family protein [Rhodobiaceae bacterium]|nr:aldehyde dehydrogenase family protein [Rhodobiaceae bacterium]
MSRLAENELPRLRQREPSLRPGPKESVWRWNAGLLTEASCCASSLETSGLIDAINASGYGLTLGVHTRIEERAEMVCDRARVGNVYVNRNQIGAIVGVQPFGGEGFRHRPKAGGPHYMHRFATERVSFCGRIHGVWWYGLDVSWRGIVCWNVKGGSSVPLWSAKAMHLPKLNPKEL